jgi:phosphoribosylamine---glycine ligase
VRVLVVGAGAREHALAWRLARSPSVGHVLAAPGNPGIEEVAETTPGVSASDVDALADLAERRGVDLTVVGPEAPLVSGLADAFARRGLAVFGPSAAGARIEGSKAFAKRLCEAHGIPAARSWASATVRDAFDALDRLPGPYVVKADGLAAGKGVTVTASLAEARRAVEESLVRRAFGDAGATVVVEEHLDGVEVSAMALTDGRTVAPLALAQDFKRALDGDEGPNTGGMGAYSPLPFVDEETRAVIEGAILRPAADALRDQGIDYRGVLYAGLMLTDDGPKVLEFNCRFGDPETQVVLPLLGSDLGAALAACAGGSVDPDCVSWTDGACVGVVLASGGYPGPFETGFDIHGIAEAASAPGVEVFHAGTVRPEGRVITSGGRVLTVVARGPDLAAARASAYEASGMIHFDGMSLRHDIAERAAAAVPAYSDGKRW